MQRCKDANVKNWVNAQATSDLYLSVISVGEIRKGLNLLSHGQKRAHLEAWFEQYPRLRPDMFSSRKKNKVRR